ncbi:hypothetical protein L8O47_10730 [Enterobacter roggenkampii]|uniref:hypothetical protein n=1 Tax=Enterobacter roggenkampii TaxID=1812935 RepID=UPI002006CB32|nr:hypothetical protein [Enterobacter roggenkampii]MCK7151382.1 hypothetical protein [Enterobacter roggenkampii]
MERAKELASLGFILVCVLVGLYNFATPDNLHALREWEAAGKRVDWAYQEETATSKVNGVYSDTAKGGLTVHYVDCAEYNSLSLDYKSCEFQQKQDRVAIADMLKTKPMEKRVDSLNNELVKIRKDIESKNNHTADIGYMVWEIKQIAYNAGVRQSEIKMPLTIKEKVILWVDTETHFIAFIIACIVAFLSFVPLVWLGLWRGVGIAVRSAKKEIKGNE